MPPRSLATAALSAVAALTLSSCEVAPPVAPVDAPAEARSDTRGTITIVLDVQPDDPVDVRFNARRKLKSFVLDDDADPTLANLITFTKLKPGAYTIQQVQSVVGTLARISCVSTSGTVNDDVDLSNLAVTINLDPAETVTCTFRVGWVAGDVASFSPDEWGDATTAAAAMLVTYFDVLYPGGVEVGIIGPSGFSNEFTRSEAVIAYLPTCCASGLPLTADRVDPTTDGTGSFGGEVLALQLNVDFGDAGILVGASGVPFGDLHRGLQKDPYDAIVREHLFVGTCP